MAKREYDFGIVRVREEADEAAEGDGEVPPEDQALAPGVPRLRSLRDGGWDLPQLPLPSRERRERRRRGRRGGTHETAATRRPPLPNPLPRGERELVLEAVLAMPGEELRMRPLGLAPRHQRLARGIDHCGDARRIIDLPRHQDLELVGQANQPPVKDPVRRA